MRTLPQTSGPSVRSVPADGAAEVPVPGGRDEPMTTLTSSDALALVERIRPVVEEHATEGELARELSPAVYDGFRDAGLLRLALPASHGGLEVDPITATCVFEALGAIDGSAAWVLNQQYAISLLSAWAVDGLDEFFADP